MKRKKIIIIISALVVVSLLIPYLAPEKLQNYVADVSTLIGVFATLLTLVLAMILYNQMGLDQTLLQKKAEVVFRLLDLLNERHFTVKTNVGYNVFLHLSTISKHKKDYEAYGQIKLLFNKGYLDCVQPIIELENNVFLPKELFYKVLRLEAKAFHAEMDKIDKTEYGRVVSHGHQHEFFSDYQYSNVSDNEWGSIMLTGENSTLINEITCNS